MTTLLAAGVFLALFIVDTGALLHLAFDWGFSHISAYWMMASAACLAVVWFVFRRKRGHVADRPRETEAARHHRRSEVKRSSPAKPRGRGRKRAAAQTRR